MEEKDHILLHWDPIEKQFLLDVSIDDLMAYLSSSKSKLAAEVISEALSFANSNGGNWKFYNCCCCNEKFDDPDIHFEHVNNTHLEGMLPFQDSILPERVSTEWESMVLNGTWKPIDTSAALEMFQEQLDLQVRDRPEYPFDDWDVGFISKELSMENHLRKGSEYILTRGWPLSDDLERELGLITVRNFLQMHFFYGTLTKALVNNIIGYSLNELEHLFPRLDTWLRCLNQTHMCICFLGASQLRKVVNFLQEVSHLPERPISDEVNDKHNALSSSTLIFKEKIVLSGNSLCIFLDGHSLGGESSSGYINNVGDQDSESIYDGLLRWSFARPSSEEQLKLWAPRQKKSELGKDLILILEKKYDILQSMLGNKQYQLFYNRYLRLIWFDYINELQARFCQREHVPQSFEIILQNIKNSEPWDSPLSRAVSDVLKEEQSRMPENSLSGLGTTFYDLRRSDDCYLTLRTETDTYIEEAFRRVCETSDLKLIKIDARMVRALAETQTLKVMINNSALVDYRVVLLRFVKSYIQSKMG